MSKKSKGLSILAATIVCTIGLVVTLCQGTDQDGAEQATPSAVKQTATPTSKAQTEAASAEPDQAKASVEPIAWQSDLDGALAQAEQDGRLVLLEYTSDRCAYCARMENDTLSRPNIISAAQQFVPVRAFPDDAEIKTRYGLNSTPSYLVLKPDGDVLTDYVGYRPPEVFLVELENAIRMDQGKPLKKVPTTGFKIGGT